MFFFSSRRRHTRWNCDWSSDVCSSDLVDLRGLTGLQLAVENAENVTLDLDDALGRCDLAAQRGLLDGGRDDVRRQRQIGRSEERRVGKECRSRWSPYQ